MKFPKSIPTNSLYIGKPWAMPGEVVEFEFEGAVKSAVVWSDGSKPRSVWVTLDSEFLEVFKPTKRQIERRKSEMPFAVRRKEKD